MPAYSFEWDDLSLFRGTIYMLLDMQYYMLIKRKCERFPNVHTILERNKIKIVLVSYGYKIYYANKGNW